MKCPEYLTKFLNSLGTEQASDVTRVFDHGYEKHNDSKWQPVCVNIDRSYAHLVLAGETEYSGSGTFESESGLPNRAHAAARLLIAAMQLMKAEGFE